MFILFGVSDISSTKLNKKWATEKLHTLTTLSVFPYNNVQVYVETINF